MLLLPARGQHRGHSGAEMPGVDFIQGEFAGEGRRQGAGVVTAAGANGLERGHAEAVLAEKPGQQRGEQSLARAGAGGGDKLRCALHFLISKRNQGGCAIKTVDGARRLHL